MLQAHSNRHLNYYMRSITMALLCDSRNQIAPCECRQEAGLLLAAATRENVSPSVILELLKRVGGIIRDYCGVLSEEAVSHLPLVFASSP